MAGRATALFFTLSVSLANGFLTFSDHSSRWSPLLAKGKASPVTSKGFGSSSPASTSVATRPNELLKQSEKRFDELQQLYASNTDDDSEDGERDSAYQIHEFVVSARLKGAEARLGATGPAAQVSDWVPIVMLAVLGSKDLVVDEALLGSSVSALAREVHYALTSQVPSLKVL